MKFICPECSTVVLDSELLKAPNPFDVTDELYGCPKCFGVQHMDGACDEPMCDQVSVYGTPTPNGYRRTCNKHIPKTGEVGL